MAAPAKEVGMHRRTLLTTAAIAVGGLFAGCSGLGNGNGNAETNGTAATATGPAESATTGTARPTRVTDTGTPQPTTTTDPETTDESVTTTEIRTETAEMPATKTTTSEATTTAPTTANAAGTETTDTAIPIPDPPSTQDGMGVARVAFENGGRVVVTGVITARNGCQEATLASAQSNGTELVITVGTERTAGTNAMCTQALTPVEYRFSLTPDTAPESVTVVHATMGKRRTVTTVERGG